VWPVAWFLSAVWIILQVCYAVGRSCVFCLQECDFVSRVLCTCHNFLCLTSHHPHLLSLFAINNEQPFEACFNFVVQINEFIEKFVVSFHRSRIDEIKRCHD
jgi:hypothetical protein